MARRMHEGVALQVLTTCGLAHRDDGETDRSPQYDPGLSMNHTEHQATTNAELAGCTSGQLTKSKKVRCYNPGHRRGG